MHQNSLLALTLLVSLAFVSCEKPFIPAVALINLDTHEADARVIKAIEMDAARDFAARNPVKFAAMYAPDATLHVNGLPVIRGSAAIQKLFAAAAKDPNFSARIETTGVHVSGDLATTEGTYRQTRTDPGTKEAVTEAGHYLTVWRKSPAGSWQAISDYSTTDPAPLNAKR